MLAREKAGGLPTADGASRTAVDMPSAMSDEDLVNALAQYLDFEPLEKQALLEQAVPAQARRVAGRAPRDEDPDRANARALERRALNGPHVRSGFSRTVGRPACSTVRLKADSYLRNCLLRTPP